MIELAKVLKWKKGDIEPRRLPPNCLYILPNSIRNNPQSPLRSRLTHGVQSFPLVAEFPVSWTLLIIVRSVRQSGTFLVSPARPLSITFANPDGTVEVEETE